MEISKLFDNILDLPGIEGVCLFDTDGRIYLNRLPAFLTDDVFAEAQRRIVAMYETMDENFLPSDDYMLRFSERWLLMRRNEQQILLVLAGERANLASTRMVTNMTLKHLTPAVMAGLNSVRPIAPAPVPAAVAATAVAAPAGAPAPAEKPVATAEEAAPKPVRIYRGRAY